MSIKKGKHEETDFELNIASIIDCFTVLITYLLVSASFISLTHLDVTVASTSGDSASDAKPPDVVVTVSLKENMSVLVFTEGSEKNTVTIQPKADAKGESSWDLDETLALVQQVKQRFPTLDSLMITADDKVPYNNVVKMIEAQRNAVAKVSLSAGFGAP